jgi:hypothetical protein
MKLAMGVGNGGRAPPSRASLTSCPRCRVTPFARSPPAGRPNPCTESPGVPADELELASTRTDRPAAELAASFEEALLSRSLLSRYPTRSSGATLPTTRFSRSTPPFPEVDSAAFVDLTPAIRSGRPSTRPAPWGSFPATFVFAVWPCFPRASILPHGSGSRAVVSTGDRTAPALIRRVAPSWSNLGRSLCLESNPRPP